MIEGIKPYPKYKDSGVPWLGQVPERWVLAPLGRYLRVKSGDMIAAEEEAENGFPIYGGNGVRGYTSKYNTEGPIVLLGRVGAKCGCVHFVSGRFWASEHALRVIPQQTMDLGYLARLLETADFNQYAIRTAQPLINSSIVRTLRVAIPSHEEQRLMAKFILSAERKIRRYIAAKRKLIKLLEEEKQAIIHRAMTRGLDPTVRLKPSGVEWVGDIPEHWSARRAKYYMCEVDERSNSGDEELLSVSHKTGVTPRSEKNITMFMAESYAGHKICRAGDIVINTMWGWMAAIGVSSRVGLVSPSYGVYRLVDGNKFLPNFLDLLLRIELYRGEYVRSSRGITSSRLRLYPEYFLNIPVLCPPLEEQKSILQFILNATAQLSSVIDTARHEIEFLDEYRTRLISDVVTGKLDVREAAVDLPDEPDDILPDIDDDALPDEEAEDAESEEEAV